MNPSSRSPITIRSISGPEAIEWVDEIASLRIRVFREYPYLYEGSEAYERKYLKVYFNCGESICVLALDAERLVGVSTGIPLLKTDPSFARPFLRSMLEPEKVFYFGESVLLSRYRGRGVGHRFFDQREAWARSLGGFRWTTFCAVDRVEDHPAKPVDYRPLDAFWHRRGYRKRPDLNTSFEWKEVGQTEETSHQMTFWVRDLTGEESVS